MSQQCFCGSRLVIDQCCLPVISGEDDAPTAEVLMRSRYTAFVLHNEAYLKSSWHPETRPESISFDKEQHWLGLRIKALVKGGVSDQTGVVEFVARYKIAGKAYRLHERSRFGKLQNRWLYITGEFLS